MGQNMGILFILKYLYPHLLGVRGDRQRYNHNKVCKQQQIKQSAKPLTKGKKTV